MKISKRKKYRTRSRLPVRIYAVDAGGFYPVHGAVKIDGMWDSFSWDAEGFFRNKDVLNDLDLIEIKPRKKGKK